MDLFSLSVVAPPAAPFDDTDATTMYRRWKTPGRSPVCTALTLSFAKASVTDKVTWSSGKMMGKMWGPDQGVELDLLYTRKQEVCDQTPFISVFIREVKVWIPYLALVCGASKYQSNQFQSRNMNTINNITPIEEIWIVDSFVSCYMKRHLLSNYPITELQQKQFQPQKLSKQWSVLRH